MGEEGRFGGLRKGLRRLIAELGEDLAGMMVTNPNTLGVFEYRIQDIAEALHSVDAPFVF